MRAALNNSFGRSLAAVALLVMLAVFAIPTAGLRAAVPDLHHAALAVPTCQPQANAAGSGHRAGSHPMLCCGAAGCLQTVPALPAALVLPDPPPRATAFAVAVTSTPRGVRGHPAVPPPRLLA